MKVITRSHCPVCDHSSVESYSTDAPQGLLHCPSCGFVFLKDVAETEDADCYEESFTEGNVHPTYQKGADGQFIIKNAPKLGKLLDLFEPWKKNGRILDVGCSVAFFLKLAESRGWKGTGAEISKWASEFSRTELGLDIFTGTLQDAKFESGSFDVVFSSHVLEHIGEPSALLQEMNRVLRPGGLLVSVVPTQFASLAWRVRRRFWGDPPPIHVSFFDKESFETLLKKNGFSPVKTRYNSELARLYEMLLSDDQWKANWKNRVEARASGKPAVASSSGRPLRDMTVSAVKKGVNLIANEFGFGDELLSLAEKTQEVH